MSKKLSERMRLWIHQQHPSWGQDCNQARWHYMQLDLALMVEGVIANTPILNERAMQADLIGRLERRNAKLMTAITTVVRKARTESYRYSQGHIVKYLYPLVPEESDDTQD